MWCGGGGVKKGEQWSVLTVIIKCEISCTHPIVTIKDGRRLIGFWGLQGTGKHAVACVQGQQMVFIYNTHTRIGGGGRYNSGRRISEYDALFCWQDI